MTTPADDFATEEAFEAFLAGRVVPEQAGSTFDGVAAFAGAVRASATQPGRPNAALAELLATGLLTDQSSPSIRTAGAAGTPPSRRARVRRRRFAMIFPVILAKFLGAGAVAQACTGAGVVIVVFTGAGAAGVLPDKVQDTFSGIVGGETSEEAPAPEEPTAVVDPATVVTEPEAVEVPVLVEEPDPAPVVVPEPEAEPALTLETWSQGPAEGQSFGEWVSLGEELGFVDWKVIRQEAQERHIEWKHDDAAGTSSGASRWGDGDNDDSSHNDNDDSDDGDHDRNRGNGNGHGNGHGNGNGHRNGDGGNGRN